MNTTCTYKYQELLRQDCILHSIRHRAYNEVIYVVKTYAIAWQVTTVDLHWWGRERGVSKKWGVLVP